jgi:hypothetical protein
MKILNSSIIVLMLILLIPSSLARGDILEVKSMSIYTDKDSYGKGDIIKISGEIQSANSMTVSTNIPVNIVITSNTLQKPIVTMKTYPSSDGIFTFSGVSTTNSSWKTSGAYTITSSYSNIVGDKTIFSFEMGDRNLLSPLQQSKLGVPSDKIECRSNLQSIIKTEDNSTACVKQQTAQILVERGWTRTTPQESPIEIIGLNANYVVGQPINATVNYTGWMNGGIYPDVKILDTSNGSKVWSNCLYAHTESPGGGGVGIAVYNIQCGDRYPVINKTGTYTMIVSIGDVMAKTTFVVIP